MDLAFGNILAFKARVEPTIKYVPTLWCFLIKQIIPHVLLALFINLAQSKGSNGKPLFGNYESYPAAPYQVLGILTFCFAVVIFLIGVFVPGSYAVLDSHEEFVEVEKTEAKTEAKPEFPVEALDDKREVAEA